MKLSSIALFLLVWVSNALSAERFTGYPRFLDGDSLVIEGHPIRLHGLDAPEYNQHCRRAGGEVYACGKQALAYLKRLVAVFPVTCLAEAQDTYNRALAVCYAGGQNINAQIVRAGYARAFVKYSDDYVTHEALARRESRGLWSGDFQNPWDFRAGLRLAAGQKNETPDCRIKGNINRDLVRIYHTPASRWYKRTKISPKKGERWFCTEAEAAAAGWRPPKR